MLEIQLARIDNGPCPYLKGKSWSVEEFTLSSFDPGLYESLLAQGFRRSGASFYRNTCPDCGRCIPVRLDLRSFAPSPSQRRRARRNAEIRVELLPATFTEERYALYSRYVEARHGGPKLPEATARSSYAAFLLQSPIGLPLISEYRLPDGSLVGTGYLDLLPGGLSSVYFAFEPRAAGRSIGSWSVTRELELVAALGKCWYYLGFWVPGSPKMDYKADFRPFEYAREGEWHPAPDRAAVLAALGAA